jgi:hypothetical protein
MKDKGGWITVVSSNNKQNKRKDDMVQYDMSSYQVKTGVIEVRFMNIYDKGVNVARSLKEFIAEAMSFIYASDINHVINKAMGQ